MSLFEVHDVDINIAFYKLLRFYHVFDLSSLKVFCFHFYRFTGIFITVFTQSCLLFGLMGCFIEMKDTINDIELFIFIFVNSRLVQDLCIENMHISIQS